MRSMVILVLTAGAAHAQTGRCYDCTLADGDRMSIELESPSSFGPLICVDAPNTDPMPNIFVATCAPQGGWGLSTFDGRLGSVTTEPRVAGIVGSPKFFAYLGPSELVASAMMGTGIPLALGLDDRTYWRLRLDLVSGQGIVETRARGAQAVECVPANP